MINYAPIGEAFRLGSDQIRNNQEEIARLTKILSDSGIAPKGNGNNNNGTLALIPQQSINSDLSVPNYVNPVNVPNTVGNHGTSSLVNPKDDSMDILKIMSHPKFDEIVKNYVQIKYPEWIYQHSQSSYPTNRQSYFGGGGSTTKSNFGGIYQFPMSKSNFGFGENNNNNGNTDGNTTIKNYILFFVISLLIYLLLEKYFSK